MSPNEVSAVIRPVAMSVLNPEAHFTKLLTDSRSLVSNDSLFFAIRTKRNSGTRYVQELYGKGVRNFVVPADLEDVERDHFSRLEGANFWYVSDVVRAMQMLAAHHRSLFPDMPVVGITGSNGKTIVKDWIVQLLAPDHAVVASPKSFNSQIGVPHSVWQMTTDHNFAVFEAGISETGEMEHLRSVVQPTIGIFTNVGQAHDENFLTRNQKVAEKLQLFIHCDVLIYCADHKEISSVVSEKDAAKQMKHFTWGTGEGNAVRLLATHRGERSTRLCVEYDGRQSEIEIPFVDRASAENAMHCVTLLFYLGYPAEEVAARCRLLSPVEMRLEMNEGINNSLLINDSYSLDLNSLLIALDFVQQDSRHFNKTLIMSDFVQSGIPEHELYAQVAGLVAERGITKFIGVGPMLCANRGQFPEKNTFFYASTEDFLCQHPLNTFQSETILLKGARRFCFENIAKVLQYRSHETIMEVNLDAMVRNLNYYRSRIAPTTKLMAMVKAASYGAGTVEIANTLQFNHVDYLTVAYADEGVELRRNGITVPMMIMNPEEESFDDIVRYNMEPDIYSFRILDAFNDMASVFCSDGRRVPIHIELDTGMHRLGFSGDDLDVLCQRLMRPGCVLEVQSVFSHLACSEDAAMDDFTRRQIELFTTWSRRLKEALGKPTLCCHILNSSGITRFPEAQMDMVRLGLGLYGLAPEADVQAQLTPVSRLRTRISQLKTIGRGESVGYNRRWVATRDSRIAIVPIGYADGLNRRLGYGRGFMEVAGRQVPVVGSICMDMCFLDVTDVPCVEGDEVVVFGSAQSLSQLAAAADTIPYEILTSVSPRVKRVYFQS